VEETAALFGRIARRIREVIPESELTSVVDNIGLPVSSINTIYNNSGTIGPQDGDFLLQLAKDHAPTADYVRKLREELPRSFPGAQFSFLPADITSQILNFGAPAPIDVQVLGRDVAANEAFARKILRRIASIPGVADARIQQSSRYPQLNVSVDRSRIGQLGLTTRDVTASVASSLAGTLQTAPVFFLNPENGVSYSIVAQVPERRVSSLDELSGLPLTGASGGGAPGARRLRRDRAQQRRGPSCRTTAASFRRSTSSRASTAATWAPSRATSPRAGRARAPGAEGYARRPAGASTRP
jgi:multidrug efflux pump subunit AcrB